MRTLVLTVLSLLAFLHAARSAPTDFKGEEREFGEHAYKLMRAVHDQTCTCKEDGNCKLSVTRDELAAQLRRYSETMQRMMPRLWPSIAKRMEAMSTQDARAYGQRLAQEYLDTLPRRDVLAWARMLSSCWGTSQEPAAGRAPTREPRRTIDKPHDGSLGRTGEIHDLSNGKLDEASAIATFLASCRGNAADNATAEPFCGCVSDYLRVSRPSVIHVLQDASTSGDVSALLELPGVKRCTQWVADGARGRSPFLRKGMKASRDVAASFARCRATKSQGTSTPSGVVFCNRLVATVP